MSKSLGWNCSIIEQFCPVVAQNGQDSVFQILSSENLSVLPAHKKLTFTPNRDWIFQPKDKFGPQEEVFAPNKLFDLLEQFIAIAIDNQKRKQIDQQNHYLILKKCLRVLHTGHQQMYQYINDHLNEVKQIGFEHVGKLGWQSFSTSVSMNVLIPCSKSIVIIFQSQVGV